MSPRRINISQIVRTVAQINAQPAVPVRKSISTIITDWSTSPNSGGEVFRIIGEAPFDGVVEEMYFTPDQTIAPDATNHAWMHVINAQLGDSRWPMTNYINTAAGVTALTQIDLEMWDDEVETVWTEPWKVAEGDLLAVAGYFTVDGTDQVWPPDVEEPFPASCTGTLTIWFRQDGGT